MFFLVPLGEPLASLLPPLCLTSHGCKNKNNHEEEGGGWEPKLISSWFILFPPLDSRNLIFKKLL